MPKILYSQVIEEDLQHLSIVGTREMHSTTTGKAALVVFIPFAVVLLVALIVVAAAGIAVLSQR
jgi:hypothetical protein